MVFSIGKKIPLLISPHAESSLKGSFNLDTRPTYTRGRGHWIALLLWYPILFTKHALKTITWELVEIVRGRLTYTFHQETHTLVWYAQIGFLRFCFILRFFRLFAFHPTPLVVTSFHQVTFFLNWILRSIDKKVHITHLESLTTLHETL